jgi:hypothetical protein
MSRGYNIFKGYPHANSADPGFVNDPIFDITYNAGVTTSDKKLFIPDILNFNAEVNCKG